MAERAGVGSDLEVRQLDVMAAVSVTVEGAASDGGTVLAAGHAEAKCPHLCPVVVCGIGSHGDRRGAALVTQVGSVAAEVADTWISGTGNNGNRILNAVRTGSLAGLQRRAAMEANAPGRVCFSGEGHRAEAEVGPRGDADVPGLIGSGGPGSERGIQSGAGGRVVAGNCFGDVGGAIALGRVGNGERRR